MLTDAARATIEQRDKERKERINGTRPLFDAAYSHGDYRLAEPGCEVFARADGDIERIRLRHDGEPRGGIILEITSTPDADGEIHRAFRCIDYDHTVPLWQATTVLTDEQVDPDTFTIPNWGRIRSLYRKMCREVGTKKGNASDRELQLVIDAARLAAIVGQRGV